MRESLIQLGFHLGAVHVLTTVVDVPYSPQGRKIRLNPAVLLLLFAA